MSDIDNIPPSVRAKVGPRDEVYVHPQGSTIIVDEAGLAAVKYRPDGRKASSSATPESLRLGHGQWKRIYEIGAPDPTADRPRSKSVEDVLAWLDGRAVNERWGTDDR